MKFSILGTLIQLFSFGFTPVLFAAQSHVEVHKFEQFKANVQDLLGEHPAHSVLSGLCREESGAGKVCFIDGIDALESDNATSGAQSAKATREDYYNDSAATPVTQNFDNYMLTKTPHMGVEKVRTKSTPVLNEWGHYFDEDEGWQHLVDPKGKEVNVGVRKMHLKRDELFAGGVVAPVVQRTGNANDTIANVPLPASQIVLDLKYSEVDIDSLPAVICEKFDDVWFTKGMPIYCAISPTLARHFKANSREMIHSMDFVRSYDNFRRGDIPPVEGVQFIVMPSSFMGQFNGIADPSETGSFTAVNDASPSAGYIVVSATAHGLLVGTTVTLAGSASTFDGSHVITAVTAGTFTYASTVTGSTTTGTWTAGGATAIDNWFAWSPDAITKVSYTPMKISEGISPDHRFDTAVYARENVDFIRTDDRGVVVGDIIAG